MSAVERSVVLFMPEGSILAHVGRSGAIADTLNPNAREVCFTACGIDADGTDRALWPVGPAQTQSRKD